MLLSVVERDPATLAELVACTGLSRPTVYRLALALERLELFARDVRGKFVLGPRLATLSVETHRDRMVRIAGPVLTELSDSTGLDARLFRRRGDIQVCVAVADRGDTRDHLIPVGTARPAKAGPIAQVLLAWEDPDELYEGLRGARFSAVHLARVRSRGWAHGPNVFVPSAVSLAVPVWSGEGGQVLAAVVVSGRPSQVPSRPGRLLTGALVDTAARISDGLLRSAGRAGDGTGPYAPFA
ncbi:helix-turn-helix domain-containing protein [Streptomyces sp. 205]|uniref:Helix-turn-helix domain-containing protein n=2 Tax=Streptomyces coffeae TaxID=621382 RepID=A0ABS1NK68_9ACTN|nr:helix-turn-helix domain-containing protein [Streptomyces coffeae]